MARVKLTTVPDEPTPLTDEALRLIGAIAVESARLEWQLAGLRRALDRSRSHVEFLAVPHDRQAKEIIRLLREGDPIAPKDEVIAWVRGASRLLACRGDLMHSSWVLGPAGGVETHHLKSGDRHPLNLDALRELLAELHDHVSIGVGLGLRQSS